MLSIIFRIFFAAAAVLRLIPVDDRINGDRYRGALFGFRGKERKVPS